MTCMHVLFSEALAQLIDAGKRVVDSPVHLADFGKWFHEAAQYFVPGNKNYNCLCIAGVHSM